MPCERYLQDFEFSRVFLPPVSHEIKCGKFQKPVKIAQKAFNFVFTLVCFLFIFFSRTGETYKRTYTAKQHISRTYIITTFCEIKTKGDINEQSLSERERERECTLKMLKASANKCSYLRSKICYFSAKMTSKIFQIVLEIS